MLERFRGFRRQAERVRDVLAALLGVLDLGVEAGDVAHAHRRHQLVALLHLGDAPRQRVGPCFMSTTTGASRCGMPS
ncbi:hypothetical protein SDC9_205508 [bioreactor metagenome]|uniref:Uncharacterized protein n=1 Tax=bioreactor metagenome TaxID=1076179 RepID=A0A645JBQ5_9ZZZZ